MSREIAIPVNDTDRSIRIGEFVCTYDERNRTVWINGPNQGDILTMAVRAIAELVRMAFEDAAPQGATQEEEG